jgi:hypothetical protein
MRSVIIAGSIVVVALVMGVAGLGGYWHYKVAPLMAHEELKIVPHPFVPVQVDAVRKFDLGYATFSLPSSVAGEFYHFAGKAVVGFGPTPTPPYPTAFFGPADGNGESYREYLLSFVMLGMFWYRHNHQYHHFHKITEGMLVLHFVQLAAAAFFPFCAALVGRYHNNLLSIVIYLGCVFVYTWAMSVNWIVARKSGALGAEVTAADYLRIRTKGLRGCLIISILLAVVVIEALLQR